MDCEASGNINTAKAIIRVVLGIAIDEEDWLRTWIDDAEVFEGKGKIIVAREVYEVMSDKFAADRSVWLRRIRFEMRVGKGGDGVELDGVLRRAVENCP